MDGRKEEKEASISVNTGRNGTSNEGRIYPSIHLKGSGASIDAFLQVCKRVFIFYLLCVLWIGGCMYAVLASGSVRWSCAGSRRCIHVNLICNGWKGRTKRGSSVGWYLGVCSCMRASWHFNLSRRNKHLCLLSWT